MPPIVLYLIKLSLVLSVVYLFYWLVLRKLTFYIGNRWYLLGYSVLAFIIPFINISPFIEQSGYWQNSAAVQAIPAIVDAPAFDPLVGARPAQGATVPGSWFWLTAGLLLGMVMMLVRLGIQYASFRMIRKKARLLIDDEVKVYQVDEPVSPFSFGKSIFINHQLHNGVELDEIIRHEFIHVRQRHTIDIIWAEVVCVLNWYNPFAWLLRRAIRQNLEFIADAQVLRGGVDKKQYQYLLLKVMGAPGFRIATAFNVNSLKKRIFMMNQVKSARIHFIRFLFMLPLIMVVVLAFRQSRYNNTGDVQPAGVITNGSQPSALQGITVIDRSIAEAPAATVTLVKDTVPATASTTAMLFRESELNPEQRAFFDKHQDVLMLRHDTKHNLMQVYDENGMTAYNLDDEKDAAAFARQYDVSLSTVISFVHRVRVHTLARSPLYVVDGKVLSKDSLSKIPSKRISSIEMGNGTKYLEGYGKINGDVVEVATRKRSAASILADSADAWLTVVGQDAGGRKVYSLDTVTVYKPDTTFRFTVTLRNHSSSSSSVLIEMPQVIPAKNDMARLLKNIDGPVVVDDIRYNVAAFASLHIEPADVVSLSVYRGFNAYYYFGVSDREVVVIKLKKDKAEEMNRLFSFKKQVPVKATMQGNDNLVRYASFGQPVAGYLGAVKPLLQNRIQVIQIF